jgi:hypothetical protein
MGSVWALKKSAWFANTRIGIANLARGDVEGEPKREDFWDMVRRCFTVDVDDVDDGGGAATSRRAARKDDFPAPDRSAMVRLAALFVKV